MAEGTTAPAQSEDAASHLTVAAGEAPPPCEDKLAIVSEKPAHSYVERKVLCSHRGFRISVLRAVVLLALAPVVAYSLVGLIRYVFPAPFHDSSLSDVLLTALGASLAVSAVIVVWTNLLHLVEQRFARIRRQSDFAAESVNIDQEERVAEAMSMLSKTWIYRIILLQWLRDVRRGILFAALFSFLVGALLMSNVPAVFSLVTTGGAFGWALVLAIDLSALILLTTRLINKAAHGSHLDPTGPVTDRIISLIAEVKDLRRGRLA